MSRFPLAYFPVESRAAGHDVYKGQIQLNTIGMYLEIEILRTPFEYNISVTLFDSATDALLTRQTETIAKLSQNLDLLPRSMPVSDLFTKNLNITNRREKKEDGKE